MLRNYFVIALRSLRRNSIYSIINLTGLSIGIACTILIFLWVHDEVTFDRNFTNYKTLHQVKLNLFADNGVLTGPLVPYPLKNVLNQQAGIKRSAIVINQSALLSVGDKKIRRTGLDASEDFLDMFDFDIIHGTREGALDDLMSIVLTQSTAIALFGTDDVVGKLVGVKIEDTEDLRVSAVIADPPINSSFNVKFILTFAYFDRTSPWLKYAQENWSNNSFNMYAELYPETEKQSVDAAIKDVIRKQSGNTLDAELFLHPLSRVRLYNNFENGKEAGGLIDYVTMFSCIGAFILVMACINFMNLATARSQQRAREVGVRKSVGSSRSQLIFQFIGESIIIAAISLAIGVVMVELALPYYNGVINKTLFIDFTSGFFWIFSFILIAATGLLAGTYPAFYLSSFKPARILKGSISADKRSSTPRQVLVVTQNVFSILLIIGTTVVYLQIRHLQMREAGYDRENLLLLWTNTDIEKNYHALKEELLSTRSAEAVTKSNSPITRIFATSKIGWPGMPPGKHLEATNIATEYDYVKTMGVKLLQGRDFSPEYKSDSTAIIINKAALDVMNMSDPIGQKIDMWNQQWTIIGVMDNVLMGGGAQQIQPLVMTMDPTWSSTITLRLPRTADVTATLQKVEQIFKKYTPDFPFEYRFADVEFQEKFRTIEMTRQLSSGFAGLAIIVTALGLFGMASFTAEQRTKEIGIRKVLGASVASVLVLLTKDFSKLVIVAFIVSVPLAWWAARSFLEQYPIRIDMPVWAFPLAGAGSLIITLTIVSMQAIRAAKGNPVDSLRSE